jgi:hypothetical protein
MQRCGLLLYGYSHIAHPSFDETVSGVLTCDLLDDAMRAPLFAYQGEARSGDSLIEGFLLVPFFKLWGRTLFPLKLLALCSAFVSLLCWITLMRRYQGTWAAIIFASLFAFPPPLFARLNLVGSVASHHLVNPLVAVQLLLLFRIVEGGAAKKSPWMWFGFGLLAGLGTFTFYTYIIFNSFCILFLIIARPRTITVSRTLLFLGGASTGFLPWFIRSLFSGAGGSYLVSILKRITIDFWSFIQNFCFILPHSFGYSYPSRDMGIIAPLFVLFIVLMGGVIIAGMVYKHPPLPLGAVQKKCEGIPLSTLQGIFFICFPLFFLSCLSLFPLLNGPVPFEYWPRIGFFGYFSTADVYRYRWLHPLYPFYFAICAVGVSSCCTVFHKTKAVKVIAVSVLIVFLCWGLVSGVKLYSKDDSGKIFSYKGYDYDQMAHRLMLSDMNRLSLEAAQHFTRTYPAENRGEVYRCLGTQVALTVVNDEDAETIVTYYLQDVPFPYVNDFIYGVVRAAQNIPEESFQPLKRAVTRNYPSDFYINWGYCHVGYGYYGLLLNRKKVLDGIPALEKWFYEDFLENFNQQTHLYDRKSVENNFLNALRAVPVQYQTAMMRGVGKLVGAEMLFDPLLSPDYPLDSSFGKQWEGALEDAFYEGVGSGFAETLARFWRTLLLPDNPEDPRYRTMLDSEWERSASLLAALYPEHVPLIKQGFVRALHQKSFDDGIRKYLGDVHKIIN